MLRMYFRRVKTLIAIVFFFAYTDGLKATPTPAQSPLDSLESLLSTTTGEKRVLLLCDLTYEFCFVQTEKAISYGRQAVKEAALYGDSLLLAGAMNDLSLAYVYAVVPDSVEKYARAAWRIRSNAGKHSLAAASLSKLANMYAEMGRYTKALEILYEVVAAFEADGDSIKCALIYGNIGAMHERNLAWSDALMWYKRSADKALNNGDTTGFLTARLNRTIALRKSGQLEASRVESLELLRTIESRGTIEQRATLYNQLGLLARSEKNNNKALDYFIKSQDMYNNAGLRGGRATALINCGNTCIDLGRKAEARIYLTDGLLLARELESNVQQRDAHWGLYQLEKAEGNFAAALIALEEYIEQNDSLFAEETTAQMAEMSVKYESEKKEKKLLLANAALQQEKIRVSKRNNWLLLAALVLALGTIIVVVGRMRFAARRREAHLQHLQALEYERRRISRDLHDHLGADITWIASTLDVQAYSQTNEHMRQELVLLGNRCREAMHTLRESIWAIHQDAITPQEVFARVASYSAVIRGERALVMNVSELQAEVRLDPERALQIYRMCKEAITNTLKHADATEFKAQSEVENGSLLIQLSDNGRGFDVSAKGGGYGLQNLQLRAKEMNGTITFRSSPNSGTLLEVRIPLNSDAFTVRN